MGIDDLIQGLADKLRATPSATNMLKTSPKDTAAALGNTASSFGSSRSTDIGLGGTSSESKAKAATIANSLKTTQQGVSGKNEFSAVVPEVAFVTSTNQKAIDNPELVAAENAIDVKAFSDADMAKIREMSGEDQPKDDSVFGWLKNFQQTSAGQTGDLDENMQAADKPELSPVQSLGRAAGSTLKTATDPRAMSQKAEENLEFLPPNMRSSVGGIVGRSSGQIADRASRVTNRISAVNDAGANIATILGMGEYYPEVTDEYGRPIKGVAGKDASYRAIDGLYNDASYLCSNVGKDFSEFGSLKDAYDILLAAAMGSGLARLVRQLMECDKYYDQRSNTVAYQGSRMAMYRGDPYTVNAGQDMYGRSRAYDPRYTSRTMISNMEYDQDNLDEYDNYLSSHNLTRRQVLEDEYAPPGTLSARQMSATSVNNSRFVKDTVGGDTASMGLSLLNMFG